MDTAQIARGMSEILVALAESPTQVTQDALIALAQLADTVAEAQEQPVVSFKAA